MLSIDQISLPTEALLNVRRDGATAAGRLRDRVLTSFTHRIPLPQTTDILHFAGTQRLEHQLWSVPRRGFTLIGIGEAYVIEGEGKQRFRQTSRHWHRLLDNAIIHNDAQAEGTGPILMGGFTFDPEKQATDIWAGYPDARLVLPRYVFTVHGTEAWLTYNKMAGPGRNDTTDDDEAFWHAWQRFEPANISPAAWPSLTVSVPDAVPWLADVAAVAAMLSEAEWPDSAVPGDTLPDVLEKVVLARTAAVHADRPFALPETIAYLQDAYTDCFIFNFQRGQKNFIGATPERLVRLTGGALETTCLAGSIGRGATEAEDESLGHTLLHDTKERREHWLVLQAMRHELDAVCECIEHGDEPSLLKLTNVQHLYTPMRARCRPGSTVFDVLERLHPTPAVGGSPRQLALPVIRDREPFDRGWYASPIGWLDARGDGEFAVALRSAVVEGRKATLFAGCGIMPTSDPVREYEESRLKLQPMISALGGGG